MAANINPRKGSVALGLIAYFEANPDEELTLVDAARKFGVSVGAIRMVLYRGSTDLEYAKVIRRPQTGRMSEPDDEPMRPITKLSDIITSPDDPRLKR